MCSSDLADAAVDEALVDLLAGEAGAVREVGLDLLGVDEGAVPGIGLARDEIRQRVLRQPRRAANRGRPGKSTGRRVRSPPGMGTGSVAAGVSTSDVGCSHTDDSSRCPDRVPEGGPERLPRQLSIRRQA